MRARSLGLLGIFLATTLAYSSTARGQTLRAQPVVTSGLTNPLYLTAPPGDTNRLFILEKGNPGTTNNGTGAIRVFDLATNTLQPLPYLTIPVSAEGERGLLGLAFDPGFATNGRLYTYHTTAGSPTDPSRGDILVTRYTANGNPLTSNTANAASGQTILTIDRDGGANNHNGGWMGFRPGGGNQLYIAVGDNGFNPDQMRNAQNTNVLLGKMLRIDVSGDTGYTNPADNPFASGGGRPEIYAYGLRNPWRDSFDRATGDFYIADVGEGAREEVSFQAGGTPGGQNYGWRVYEGTQFTGLEAGPTTGITFPIHEYGRNLGSSITGGYVYRGLGIPGLQGDYFYGDFVSGRIWSGERSGNTLANIIERTTQLGPAGGGQTWGGRLASFGEGADGELYMVGFNGAVYRIIPEPGTWLLSIAALAGLAIAIRRRAGGSV